MNSSSHPNAPSFGQTIREWAPVAVILLGGIATWFSLAAKVDRLDMQHAEWRQQHLAAVTQLSTRLEQEQAHLRALTVDVARLATLTEAIREELRRQGARQDRLDQERGQPMRER
jgi:ferredoxin-NADP reductase